VVGAERLDPAAVFALGTAPGAQIANGRPDGITDIEG
jgi:hypothetical protein